jgi:hypothetical protein
MNTSRSWRAFVSVLSFSCALGIITLGTGCQEPKGALKGSVTYKSSPVTGGGMTFYDQKDKQIGGGTIDENGNYIAVGLPVGKMKVTIETDSAKQTGRKLSPAEERALKDKKGVAPSQNKLKYVKIPPKYSDKKKTTLTVEIKGGDQQWDITLTD